MFLDDTIVAVSSASGKAARMVLRLTGPAARGIAGALRADIGRSGGVALRRDLHFAGLVCPAWIYFFAGPRSYTGQDLIEVHIPGNPLLARMLLDWIVGQGARIAEPGEFTARAYFNGKLDLSQAEGVAAAIAAQSRQHLDAARQLMAGELARRLTPIMDFLAETLALVEAGIDFSDEGIQFLSSTDLIGRIAAILEPLDSLAAGSGRFEKLTHEPVIVLAGRPNAGKSTLTNRLAGWSRAVVSPTPGTTRDALSVEIALPRGVARLVDVAGLEQSPRGEIEIQMRAMAQRAIEQADVVVLVRDITDDRPELSLPRPAHVCVRSKVDSRPQMPHEPWALMVSAITGHGLDELRAALDRAAFGAESGGASLALTSRHLQCLDEAITALRRSAECAGSPEVLAAELRGALDALGQILGAVTPDDILGKIFSKFCIGK